MKVAQSCPTLCDPMDCPWNSPGQKFGVGRGSLLQGIFPTQGSNPGLPHCRWILYHLSRQVKPEIHEHYEKQHSITHTYAHTQMQNCIPLLQEFPCGSAGQESACNVGDLGLIPGLGRSPGEGKGYPLQYSGLENSMDSPWGRRESDTTKQLSLHFTSLHFN